MSFDLSSSGTAFLECASRLITTYPSDIVIAVKQRDTNADAAVFSQQTATSDAAFYVALPAANTGTDFTYRNVGGAPQQTGRVLNSRTAGVWKWYRFRLTSASSRQLTIDTTTLVDATTVTNDFASHDRFTLGAIHWNNVSPLFLLDGQIAELGVFNGSSISDSDFAAVRAGTLYLENVTGVTTAHSLLTKPAGTTITASDGKVFTLNGTVTQGADHPVSRTSAPALSSASASATSATTVGASVTTDTGSGTLYFLLSTNATETAATIAGSSNSQVVTSTGAKTLTSTGLTPGASLYPHYVQVVGGLYSNVINGSVIVMPAAGAPGAATINSIIPGNGLITVGYTAGAANGSTITGHVLKAYRASDNVLVATSASSLASPISVNVLNGVSVYGKIESTNSAGTTASTASGNVTPSATVTTSTITPPNIPLATAAGATGSGSVWVSEPVKIVVINATDPTQATQVFSQTTSSVGKLGAITITGAAGFLAQVMVWRVADRTFLGSFPATSA